MVPWSFVNKMTRPPSSSLVAFLCLVLFSAIVQPSTWQTDILTVFLDEEISRFDSLVRDRFHYRLMDNGRYHYFDYRFLNSSHSSAIEQRPPGLIEMYELEEATYHRIEVVSLLDKPIMSLRCQLVDKRGKTHPLKLANHDEVEKIQVKFVEDSFGIGVLVYYDQRNDDKNKTAWLIHMDNNYTIHPNSYSWKTFTSTLTPVKIIPQNSMKFFFLYDDFFFKANYSKDEEFVNFQADSVSLPHLGLYSMPTALDVERYMQIPLFCGENYSGPWNKRLFTYLVDAYRASTEQGSSFFFLFDNHFDQSQAVCVLNSELLAYAFNKNGQFFCDKEQHPKCNPKKLPLLKMVLKFERSTYQRIFVKQIYDEKTKNRTSIIFLLEKGHRQQLLIYDLIESKRGESVVCFEGIYKLRSQKELILDVQLENQTDSLLIITKNYIQRIPIGSFCTANSFSSCQSVSTCTLRSSICENPRLHERGCQSPHRFEQSKMNSDEFMCDRETREVCLVGQVKPQTKANYQGKLCNEDSCRCQSELCVPGSSCTFDEVRLTYCFLPRSKLKLSSYELGQPYEPFATMVIASFVTLLSIAFFLVTFYCCFSMTQSSKKTTAISDLSTLDLSKIDVKQMDG